jgi:hypothetical protein
VAGKAAVLLRATLWNSVVCFPQDGCVPRTQTGGLLESISLVRLAATVPIRAVLLALHAISAATDLGGCGSGSAITATKPF